MNEKPFDQFERIARIAHSLTDEEIRPRFQVHPFDERAIHSILPSGVKKLFDDGHFAQATFEAFKYVDKEVGRLAGLTETGYILMMKAFSETSPALKLNDLSDASKKDEQKGFMFIFSGSVLAIRNPRGHEYAIRDSIEDCLDHLSLVSLLLRKLENSGFRLQAVV